MASSLVLRQWLSSGDTPVQIIHCLDSYVDNCGPQGALEWPVEDSMSPKFPEKAKLCNSVLAITTATKRNSSKSGHEAKHLRTPDFDLYPYRGPSFPGLIITSVPFIVNASQDLDIRIRRHTETGIVALCISGATLLKLCCQLQKTDLHFIMSILNMK